jgi:lipoprotein-anchoring transpeptidase ErfK/SrfK
MNDIFSRSPVRLAGSPHPGDATVHAATLKKIVVDIESQTLIAYDGNTVFRTCACVTGKSDHPTSQGTWHVMEKRNPCSSLSYKDKEGKPIPMNYAMRFTPDWQAIHEFNANWYKDEGDAAKWLQWKLMNIERWLADNWDAYRKWDDVGSHGCVRLNEDDAKALYEWVPDPQKTPLKTTVLVK